MALIKNLKQRSLQRHATHSSVEASYSVIEISSGKPLLQIDTFGSAGRKLKGKTSQSIQVDKKCAEQLIRILTKTFDL